MMILRAEKRSLRSTWIREGTGMNTVHGFASRTLPIAAGMCLMALGMTVQAANPTQAVEYFHRQFGHYFVTADAAEAAALDAGKPTNGWARTGQTFSVDTTAGAGQMPVCRFFSAAFARKSSHFFTADPAECAEVKGNSVWHYEGIAFQAGLPTAERCPAGTAPLYRLYNDGRSGAPNHRYTSCPNIRDRMHSLGWIAEGLAMCVAAASTDCSVDDSAGAKFTMDQTLSDGAQRTTLAFSGLAMITGNLGAQSFFPPGKVADYTGFQYLRDNDPDNMGHNTSFLTRIANNVIFILDDAQFTQLKSLAMAQASDIDLYGYKRFPLMKAFRRVMDGDVPVGSSGLNLNAVKKASRELYLIDGQISFDRALLYAAILRSMTQAQKSYLNAMKGMGWNSWPNISDAQIRPRMSGLPQGTSVAVMTYASDLFSWYAGSLEADVYFCPERHGTYYGGFYIKDAPAVGHEGYSIDEQLTATAGRALSDASVGYVTESQAALMSSLVVTQKGSLFASPAANIVDTRTAIAAQLRTLLLPAANASAVKARVLELSALYGELDGANNHAYATVFAQVNRSLTSEQRARLEALRRSIMSGTYADGTAFDFSSNNTPYLYSSVITDPNVLTPYIGNTDYLFFEP
jgi:hypothetical protein